MSETLAFVNATILDCTGRDPYSRGALVVRGRRIQALRPMDEVSFPMESRVIDLGGMTIMPGLIDAHAHVALVDGRMGGFEAQFPGAIFPLTVAQNIRDYLAAGFTTIRDAGGCDWSFKHAVERGLIQGPHMFISNGFISQTGGHGDLRLPHHHGSPHSEHPLYATTAIADGPDQVRRAAREQLRLGADQVKVMAGGGASSPTDLLDAPQYTTEELAAAVYEAKAVKKYVMAHVYVPRGIKNCVEAGVLSIEHGNFMDEETALLMKERGMFLVPTLANIDARIQHALEYGLSELVLGKFNQLKAAGTRGLEVAMAAGVKIGSGSDVSGPYSKYRSAEFMIKAQVMGPMASLVSATRTNAELLGIDHQVGTLEPGKLADLIVLDVDPLENIEALQDLKRIRMVLKEGRVEVDRRDGFSLEPDNGLLSSILQGKETAQRRPKQNSL